MKSLNPLGSHWVPKTHTNRQKYFPRAHFLRHPMLVSKCNDFLTPWNLEHSVFAYITYLCSLFRPALIMSSFFKMTP